MGVCVQEDLSEPLYEEDLDGSAGVLFPFYDPDTNMLYLAGKVTQGTCTQNSLHFGFSTPCAEMFFTLYPCPQGDGNIRYYELSAEKPYLSFLTEYRSPLPQKGLGEIRKGGRCSKYRNRMSTWVTD